MKQQPESVKIRDPIYGNIEVSQAELTLIEHRYFQRLRRIKQLGFGEYVYPGAVHTRYGHSLGVMEVASRIFERLFPSNSVLLSEQTRQRFKQIVRIAGLLHDLGHAPLSHVAEDRLPAKQKVLPKPMQKLYKRNTLEKPAVHEDYTYAILLESDLASTIEKNFSHVGITAADVVSVLRGANIDPRNQQVFMEDGIDFLPVLHQMISSEMDADRMDYLLRDALFCGVSYGRYDQDWLISNLVPVEHNGRMFLGLKRKAVFSFEDFLLSRYHMFITVYLHYRARGFNRMLSLFFDETNYTFPHDIESYCALDDFELYAMFKNSNSKWARNLIQAKSFYKIVEWNSYDSMQHKLDVQQIAQELEQAGIPLFVDTATGMLSYYYSGEKRQAFPIFVLSDEGEKFRIDEYSPLFERFSKPVEFVRIYVDPARDKDAEFIVAKAIEKQNPK